MLNALLVIRSLNNFTPNTSMNFSLDITGFPSLTIVTYELKMQFKEVKFA